MAKRKNTIDQKIAAAEAQLQAIAGQRRSLTFLEKKTRRQLRALRGAKTRTGRTHVVIDTETSGVDAKGLCDCELGEANELARLRGEPETHFLECPLYDSPAKRAMRATMAQALKEADEDP